MMDLICIHIRCFEFVELFALGSGIWGKLILNMLTLLCFGGSEREYQRGDEIAWYADGDKIVRNEYNPMTAYAFGIFFFFFSQCFYLTACFYMSNC